MRSRQIYRWISELLTPDQTSQRLSELLSSGSHLKIRTGSLGWRGLGAHRTLLCFSGQVLEHDALLQRDAPEGGGQSSSQTVCNIRSPTTENFDNISIQTPSLPVSRLR